MNDLELYREQLALCDDKIIDALVERSMIIEKIMAYKEEYGMPILQSSFLLCFLSRLKNRHTIFFFVCRFFSRDRKQSRKEDWKKSFQIIVTRMRSVTFSIVSARTASGFKQENCLITILYSLVLWAQAYLRSQII